MSSNIGTQSPPLEATNEHIPMGSSSVSDAHDAAKPGVKDVDQRAEYFHEKGDNSGVKDNTSGSAGNDISSASTQAEKSAQSVTNKQREHREM